MSWGWGPGPPPVGGEGEKSQPGMGVHGVGVPGGLRGGIGGPSKQGDQFHTELLGSGEFPQLGKVPVVSEGLIPTLPSHTGRWHRARVGKVLAFCWGQGVPGGPGGGWGLGGDAAAAES